MVNSTIRKWSEMQKLEVYIPGEGRSVGWADDFYFKGSTNSIYALRVHTHLTGERALPITGIQSIGDKVSIHSEQMLTKALPPLPQGGSLRGNKVVGENGSEVGIVEDVFIAVDQPQTLRIAAIELAGPAHQRFSADAIVSYDEKAIVIYNRTARRLR